MFDGFVLEILKSTIIALASGIPSFVIGMWFFNKYILPRMVPDMIERVLKTGEVQDLFKRGRDVLDQIEPFIERVKGLKLEKIDGEVINDLIRTVKELADRFGKTLMEQPNIPEPEELR